MRKQHVNSTGYTVHEYTYLDGFTIPDISCSILTTLFLLGKSLKNPRMAYNNDQREIETNNYLSECVKITWKE